MLAIVLFHLLFLFIHEFSKIRIRNDIGYKNKQRVNFQIILVFFALFVFFGFRDLHILNDTNHYYLDQYDLIVSNDITTNGLFYVDYNLRFEPGYQIFQRIIAFFFHDPYALIIITSFIFLSLTIWFTKCFIPQVALAVFFYMAFGDLFVQVSAIRQSLSICAFFVSFKFFQEKKFIYTILLLALSCSFHSSAIILPLFLGLCLLDFNKKNVSVISIFSIITLIALYPIFEMIGMDDHVYMEAMLSRETAPIAAIIGVILTFIICIICYRLKKRFSIDNPPKIVLWGSVMCLIVNLLSTKFLILGRFSLYFSPFVTIMFIYFLYNIPKRLRRNILSLVIFVLLIKTIITLKYRNEWFHLVPYSFFNIFEGVKLIETGY